MATVAAQQSDEDFAVDFTADQHDDHDDIDYSDDDFDSKEEMPQTSAPGVNAHVDAADPQPIEEIAQASEDFDVEISGKDVAVPDLEDQKTSVDVPDAPGTTHPDEDLVTWEEDVDEENIHATDMGKGGELDDSHSLHGPSHNAEEHQTNNHDEEQTEEQPEEENADIEYPDAEAEAVADVAVNADSMASAGVTGQPTDEDAHLDGEEGEREHAFGVPSRQEASHETHGLSNPEENPYLEAAVSEGTENVKVDETRHASQHDTDLQDQALDDILNADSSAGSMTLNEEDAESEMPEIIVSWHGVDYPLFYNSPGSEGRQCFFDDMGLLECSMEDLLKSFRQELAEDVAEVEELVLQINEMGLEFAESSHPSQFLDITLGSILQVFNDLVKNQDPEASRPLYAYLITRPSCSKRWQALIEDAYQGKNIEEVSICFSGDPHASGGAGEVFMDDDAGTSDGQDSDHTAEDEAVGDEGDYAAHDNDNDGNGYTLVDEKLFNQEPGHEDLGGDQTFDEEPHANTAAADDGGMLSHEHELADPVEELETAISEMDDSAALTMLGDDDFGQLNEHSEHAPEQNDHSNGSGNYDPCHKPDFCFCDTCVSDEEMADMHETGIPCSGIIIPTCQGYSLDAACCQQPALLPSPNIHLQEPRTPGRLAFPSDKSTNEHSEANDIIALQETDGVVKKTEDQHGDDNAVETNDSAGNNVENVSEDKVTPLTATAAATDTAAIDEHEDDDFNADIDLDADIQTTSDNYAEPTTAQSGGGDALDEIDWQDEDEDASKESTAPGKRPRPDEDGGVLDAEDEQDAKRRRS